MILLLGEIIDYVFKFKAVRMSQKLMLLHTNVEGGFEIGTRKLVKTVEKVMHKKDRFCCFMLLLHSEICPSLVTLG